MPHNLLEHHEKDRQTTVSDFKSSVFLLNVTKQHVRGHVLLAGHGPAAPEQCLFADSPYETFDTRRVQSLVAVDAEWKLPDFLFSSASQKSLYTQKFPLSKNRKGIFSGVYSLYELQSEQAILPQSLQCILFFRIPDLQYQLSDGLLEWMYHLLVQGGYLICSGSCDNHYVPEYFTIDQCVHLSTLDPSGYLFGEQNLGFVLRK